MTSNPKPVTVAQAFEVLHDALKLDPDERQRAIDIHNQIADILSAEDYVDGHFLQGSLARKTMTNPLRDIDMVVTLAESFAKLYSGDLVEKGIRASASSESGPLAAMHALQAVLEPHFPGATFEVGKHALTIDFGDESFKFDVVPALDEGDDVFIANTHTGRWERSNTRELIRTVSERNQSCNRRFVHQVRMIKHAVKQHPTIGNEFFGLLSESITYYAVEEGVPHSEACARAFSLGAQRLAGDEILDPTGEDNLLAKLDPAVKEDAQHVFAEWAEMAEEARTLATAGDDNAAIDIWHSIFGDAFPKAPKQSTAAAAEAWVGGGLTSTGRITRHTTRETARPSRSWRSP